MENIEKTWKPKRWLALLLSIFFMPLNMLYLCKIKLFWLYLTLFYATATVMFMQMNNYSITITFVVAMLSLILINIFHTYKISTNFVSTSKRVWYSHWWGILSIYISMLSLILIFRSFFYEPFHLPANSMAPTYNKGDYIIISKLGYGNYGSFGVNLLHTTPTRKVQRGDVLVFSYPPNPKIDYIKRVIGTPGDVISYKSKYLFINNQAVSTKAIGDYQQIDNLTVLDFKEIEETLDGNSWHVINLPNIPSQDFEFTVPPDNYFVMGDNRDNSSDSRIWGTVPSQNFKGKVIYTTAKH